MKNLTLVIFLALTLIFGACSISECSEKKKDPKKQIAKYDTDQDGKISSEEVMTIRKKRFSKYDKNKDGFIQKDEMKSKNKKGSGKRFIKLDVDKDSQVTMEEWLAPSEKSFKNRDSNQDGFLTADELNPNKDKE